MLTLRVLTGFIFGYNLVHFLLCITEQAYGTDLGLCEGFAGIWAMMRCCTPFGFRGVLADILFVILGCGLACANDNVYGLWAGNLFN